MKLFRINDIAIAKIFVFLLLFYMNVISFYYQIPNALLYLGILAGIPLVVFLVRSRLSLSVIMTTEIWLYIVFFFIILVTGYFVAPNKSVLLKSSFTYIQTILFIVFLLVIVSYDKSLIFIEFLIITIGMIVAITVLLGIDSISLALAGREQMFKGSITKVNPNSVGLIQAASFTMLLFQLRRLRTNHEVSRSRRVQGLALICIGLCVNGLVVLVTGSRKSFLAVMLSLIMFIILSPKGKIAQKIVMVFFAGMIIFIVIYLGSVFLEHAYIFRRFVTFFDETSNIERINMIREGFQLLEQSPFFGVGLGNYAYASSFGTYSHNTIAEALSTTGLVGSTIYFATYISLMVKLFRLARKKESKEFGYNGIILFSVLLFLAIGVIHFYEVQSALLFAYIIGGTMLYDTKGKRTNIWYFL